MFTLHRNIRRSLKLLPALILLPSLSQAAGSAASSLMSQAMLSMMDAMGNLAQGYNRDKNWRYGGGQQPFNNWQSMGSAPWAMYAMPGGGIPGQQQLQGMMTQAPATALSGQQTLQGMVQQTPGSLTGTQQQYQDLSPSSLDGIWQGQGGEIVLVMYGHFRIYANADHYRDGRYEVRDNWIVMQDPETGSERAYEFALDQGRLVLKSKDSMLLFRQLPIPVPPYSIFSGQGSNPGQYPNPAQRRSKQQANTDTE